MRRKIPRHVDVFWNKPKFKRRAEIYWTSPMSPESMISFIRRTAGGEEEGVANHQHQAVLLRESNEFFTFRHGASQRFSTKTCLPASKAALAIS